MKAEKMRGKKWREELRRKREGDMVRVEGNRKMIRERTRRNRGKCREGGREGRRGRRGGWKKDEKRDEERKKTG